MRELERTLSAPRDWTVPGGEPGGLVAERQAPVTLDAVYYDTPDLRFY